MPTPVTAARQCLTQESAAVLDEAVAVALRRGHAQTTSLHMVSSLLSLPNSSLREACTRARNNAYSSRVQFKALELSLGVSLDRLPSAGASRVDQPPVSNSLMAAIKRSQANQRRQPENFTFYQQQQQQQYSSCSSLPVVKVELRNLILAILDDPLVSRVFGEAGFRSCDIKMATIRPGSRFYTSNLFGSPPRCKRPSFSFSFPFMGCFPGDENSRRIGEIMLRGKKRCPLLLGISAGDALKIFLETVQRWMNGFLPDGLHGLSVVCVKDEIVRYLNGDCDEGPLRLRLEEVERMMENVAGGGLVVNYGDLNAFVDGDVSVDSLRFLVGRLGRLIEVYGRKLRLIGSAGTYEVYFKVMDMFPTIEEDWDLEVLPITSLKFSVGGSFPRSSLMESFVPLGGFFSLPPETKCTSSNARQYRPRCHLCNEKYEQEVAAHSNGGRLCTSVTEQCQSSLPSWLQSATPGSHSRSSPTKGKDDRVLLNAKIAALQKKWDSICEQHHFNRSFSNRFSHQFGYQAPRVFGLQVDEGKREKASNNCNELSNEQGNKNANSSLSNLQKRSSLKELSSLDTLSKPNNQSVLLDSGLASPHSDTSVITDLGLGIFSPSTKREQEKSSLSFCGKNLMHSDEKDLKSLYKSLLKRFDQQEEAISSIIETISHGGNSRRNIWIILRGADGLGKKKLGLALAETLFGSKESLIYIDLSFHDDFTHIDSLFASQVRNKYDITMRGTVIDYLVEKLSKKPSVVFFENIDKADLVVQNSLSQAVKCGRFTDLCGREVSVSNCIFLGAIRFSEGDYTEEDLLSTKGSSIQILIRFDLNDDSTKSGADQFSMNKRKLICGRSEAAKRANKTSNSQLDLNLPADGSEVISTTESDTDSTSENPRLWLDDFERQADQTVVFKPFDFKALAEKLFECVSKCLHDVVGNECSIDIMQKVMQQLLAAGYLSGKKKVEDWIHNVLRQGFKEAMGKFSIDARSIVKLVTCDDGAASEEQPEGLLLPARIVMK